MWQRLDALNSRHYMKGKDDQILKKGWQTKVESKNETILK
jgi:hypothetical protein